MIDFSDDVSTFLADSPHEAVVGSNDPVRVVYDAPAKPAHLYDTDVDTIAPACSMADVDATRLGIQYGTPVIILKKGVPVESFTVKSADPDGAGLTRITLTLAED